MDHEQTPSTSNRKSRRGWFRFSLRTLLLAITIFSIGLGWWVNNVWKQHLAVTKIKAIGGGILYDYQYNGQSLKTNAPPPGPSWLHDHVDLNLYCNVTMVVLSKPAATDLDVLGFRNLTHLKYLDLRGSSVKNLSPLSQLTELKKIFATHTLVTGAEVEKLQRALPACQIIHESTQGPGVW